MACDFAVFLFEVGFLFGWVFQIHIMNQKNVNFENTLIHSIFSVTTFQSLVPWHFTVSLLFLVLVFLKFCFFAYYGLLLILGHCIFIVISVWIRCTSE